MESLSERNESQRVENAKIWQKRKKKIFIFLGIAVFVLAIVVCIWRYYTKEYTSYVAIESIERSDTTATNFMEYNGKLMKYSRDGAVGYNTNLNMEWSGSYNFSSPIVDTCNEYVAVADSGGTEIYVFDGSDSPTEIDVLYPISLIQVAAQGVVAVVMSNDNSDLVQIYDSSNSGELLVEFTTNVSEDGYPVDIVLSPDGTKLVTTYLNVTNGTPTSKVTFYNLGEVGKNYSNNIVAAKTFQKEIISRVEFFGNNTVCVFGEQGFSLYSMKQLVEDVATKEFKKIIKSVFFTDEYLGFILDSGKAEEPCTVELYNMNGKCQMSEEIHFAYSSVYMVDDEIIFMSNQDCYVLRTNGKVKFHCTFKSPISYIMPISGFNKYLLVDDNNISTIKIVGE